jgi:hypothetical protein
MSDNVNDRPMGDFLAEFSARMAALPLGLRQLVDNGSILLIEAERVHGAQRTVH